MQFLIKFLDLFIAFILALSITGFLNVRTQLGEDKDKIVVIFG